jgi:hypothetical protein
MTLTGLVALHMVHFKVLLQFKYVQYSQHHFFCPGGRSSSPSSDSCMFLIVVVCRK